MLEIDPTDNSRFQVIAYQKASLTIATIQEDVADIYEKRGMAGLMELPGIGKALAQKIADYLTTGKIKAYEELKKKYPINFSELTAIGGMGAKKAFKLYKELGVKNVDDLKKAIDKHQVSGLEGFGEKSEEKLKHGIEMQAKSKGRLLLGDALPVAEALVEKLKKSGLVDEAMVAGSARRMRETVGDLDILVISSQEKKVMDFFTSYRK